MRIHLLHLCYQRQSNPNLSKWKEIKDDNNFEGMNHDMIFLSCGCLSTEYLVNAFIRQQKSHLHWVDRNNRPPIWETPAVGAPISPIYVKENSPQGHVVTTVRARFVHSKVSSAKHFILTTTSRTLLSNILIWIDK